MSEHKRVFHDRRFLNADSGAAVVEADLYDNSWNDKNNGERHVSVSGTLHVTDCARSISLDFSYHDLDDAREQVRKLDRLIDAAQGMRDAIVRSARREWPGRKV